MIVFNNLGVYFNKLIKGRIKKMFQTTKVNTQLLRAGDKVTFKNGATAVVLGATAVVLGASAGMQITLKQAHGLSVGSGGASWTKEGMYAGFVSDAAHPLHIVSMELGLREGVVYEDDEEGDEVEFIGRVQSAKFKCDLVFFNTDTKEYRRHSMAYVTKNMTVAG